jgi:DNA-binding CsgD family transcriptional regulator
MLKNCEKVFNLVQSANDVTGLQRAAKALRERLGLAHVIYHWVNSKREHFRAGTYPQDWVDRYFECDYLWMDPVIIGGLKRFEPFDWKELDWSSRTASSFLREAMAHGVGNQGYTVPIRGPSGQFALLSLSDYCDDLAWADFVTAQKLELILLAHEFNRKALDLEVGSRMELPALSRRELAAMSYLARGLNRAQAAAEMNISKHTLRVHIEAARHKLRARNTTHAVARALSAGLIVV